MSFPSQPQAKSADTTAFDIARADSRDCPYCNGEGTRTVFAPGYDGNPVQFDDAGLFCYPARVIAHCRCPLGRFIRAASRDDVRQRVPEIDMILQGRSHWLLDDPTEARLDDPTSKADEAANRALWRQIRSNRISKKIP